MGFFTEWLSNLVDVFHSAKDKNLQWQLTNQRQKTDLRQRQALAEQALEVELKKKSLQLEHEIALLKTKSAAELSMFKTRCKQDIEDYKQYLASLDKLKQSIRNSYTHLPESVAFTIHHHAKYLLHKMWEAEDFEEKMRHEMQLIQFMAAVHEDARQHLEGASTENLPQKTLQLIQRQ
jgi:transposase-like protein